MSSESSKKRKPKVIRSDGAPAEGKRNRSDTEQEGKYYSEEAEVDLRDPGRDYELYKYTCQELQRLMAEIQDLKSRGGKDVAIEIEDRRIQSCVHFMTLKKLNRLAHIRLKKGRDQTHEAKQNLLARPLFPAVCGPVSWSPPESHFNFLGSLHILF
uniref:THO complex subunit 5 n=1 Tax=Sus scrofa TaxID=9823 RepID=A0A8D1BM71_PIG